jgi:hypothetical protein
MPMPTSPVTSPLILTLDDVAGEGAEGVGGVVLI